MQRFTKEIGLKDLEIWKVYGINFESNGLLVSSHGNVKNLKFEDKKIGDNGAGYKNCGVSEIGRNKKKTFYVHRLVAELFSSKSCIAKTQVNHIDGDKCNNHHSNLEWVSPKENIQHMHENGFSKKRRELKNTVKLEDEVISKAYREVKMGLLGVRESADKYGMPRTTLSSIMNKRSRRDVTDRIDRALERECNQASL